MPVGGYTETAVFLLEETQRRHDEEKATCLPSLTLPSAIGIRISNGTPKQVTKAVKTPFVLPPF
jgi:hypothetical protein